MVGKSREYLETMLEEYNEKVNRLENGDPSPLMEAYVNRGHVLAVMGHHTSAIDDFHSAIELAEDIEDSGGTPDPDSVFKAMTSMGLSMYKEGLEFVHVLEYASEMVGSLRKMVRHFDGKSLLRTCIECADALMYESRYESAERFLDRVLRDCSGTADIWYRNRHAEALSMYAECEGSYGRWDSAISRYTESIEHCEDLMMNEALDDLEILCDSFIGRASCHSAIGQQEDYVMDLMSASEIVHIIRKTGRDYGYDTEAEINSIIMNELTGLGKTKEAEIYALRSMTARLEIAKRNGDKGPGPF